MLMTTENLCKFYRNMDTAAVDHGNITLDAGETVGLFGESGSGKSTMGMMAAGLLKPTSGRICYEGREIRMPYRGQDRRDIQVLFQHPETSFNPALILLKSMVEPYSIYSIPYTMQGMLEYLSKFGLYEEHLHRTPSQLSGGELQRAALARILLIQPKIIVLDEPTSMLDVITQAQIIEILRKYQKQSNAAYLMITHNAALCKKVCSRAYRVKNGVFTPTELSELESGGKQQE